MFSKIYIYIVSFFSENALSRSLASVSAMTFPAQTTVVNGASSLF
jgi:hypothetical protein